MDNKYSIIDYNYPVNFLEINKTFIDFSNPDLYIKMQVLPFILFNGSYFFLTWNRLFIFDKKFNNYIESFNKGKKYKICILLLNKNNFTSCILNLFKENASNFAEYNKKIKNEYISHRNILKIISFSIICFAIFIPNYFIHLYEILCVATISFKFLLSIFGFFYNDKIKTIKNKSNDHKPIVSIIVPLYKEQCVLKQMIDMLKNINYILEKLDIKFVFEEEDKELIDLFNHYVKTNLLDNLNYDVIIVPSSQFKTKAKACNYALYFCYGKYTMLYDADDIADQEQILNNINIFQNDSSIVAIQNKLSYYNNNSYLINLFSLEYSLYFNLILPALNKIGLIVPLSGSSNIFNTNKLHKEFKGWNSYNLTEDAELGVRFNLFLQKKEKIAISNSYTYEDAPNNLIKWLKQRSRWIKGFIQTGIFFNQNIKIFFANKNLSLSSKILKFIFFQLIFSIPNYIFFTSFILPFVIFNIGDNANHLIYIAIYYFITNYTIILLGYIKKKKKHTIKSYIFFPIYLALNTIAIPLAMYSLIKNTFYWEKTTHLKNKKIN